MSRTAWIIVIVLIVIVLLFVVYKYMFNKNKPDVSTTVNNNGNFSIPKVIPAEPLVVPPTNIISNGNTNNDVIVNDVQNSLNTVLRTLGYSLTTDEQGNVNAIGSPSDSKSSLIKSFGIKFKGADNVLGNSVDGKKWNEYVSNGLENISYNIKDDKKASEIYNKIVSFWGASFFNTVAQKITEIVKNSSKSNIDCNSKEYKDKLNLLAIKLKQAQQAYQVAVFNMKVDNSENRQALDRTGRAVDALSIEYTKWLDLCKS